MRTRLLAALLTAALLLTACAASSAVDSPVTITVWTYYNGPQKVAFDELVLEFNQTAGLAQGIVVEAFSQGQVNALAAKVLAAAAKKVGSSELPDVFATYADNAVPLAEMGLLVDFNTCITPEEQALYFPSYLEEGYIGGELVILPSAKSTELLMLNRTDWEPFAAATGASLDELGTLEGLVDVSRRYFDWSGGKAFFGRDAMANYMLVGSRQLGRDILVRSPDGDVSVVLDRDAMRRLWEGFYIPYINGWFVAEGRFRSDDAKIGALLAYQGSSTSATYFPGAVTLADESSYPVEALALPAPIFSGGRPVAVQQGAGMAVVKSDPERELAAVTFLRWLSDSRNNIAFSAASGYLPATIAACDPAFYSDTLASLGDGLSSNLAESLPVALEQMLRSELYFPPVFEHGVAVRAVLEESLLEFSLAGAREVAALTANGMSPAEAAAACSDESRFTAWYELLTAQIAEATAGA